jgi:hypothetical protein
MRRPGEEVTAVDHESTRSSSTAWPGFSDDMVCDDADRPQFVDRNLRVRFRAQFRSSPRAWGTDVAGKDGSD